MRAEHRNAPQLVGRPAVTICCNDSVGSLGRVDSRQPVLAWAIPFDRSRGIKWVPPPPPEPVKLWSEPAIAKPGLLVTLDGVRWATVTELTASGNARLEWLDGTACEVKQEGLKGGVVRPSSWLVAVADSSMIPDQPITAHNVIAASPAASLLPLPDVFAPSPPPPPPATALPCTLSRSLPRPPASPR